LEIVRAASDNFSDFSFSELKKTTKNIHFIFIEQRFQMVEYYALQWLPSQPDSSKMDAPVEVDLVS